ncbi:MAG: hypothetical protein H7257_03465 [Taibaiella sp.]|nr:hypothetical protein [Taibaiella sp.]
MNKLITAAIVAGTLLTAATANAQTQNPPVQTTTTTRSTSTHKTVPVRTHKKLTVKLEDERTQPATHRSATSVNTRKRVMTAKTQKAAINPAVHSETTVTEHEATSKSKTETIKR